MSFSLVLKASANNDLSAAEYKKTDRVTLQLTLKESIEMRSKITSVILLHEKFLQFDWLRAVVFQLNLKYLHVKITNLLRVVV